MILIPAQLKERIGKYTNEFIEFSGRERQFGTVLWFSLLIIEANSTFLSKSEAGMGDCISYFFIERIYISNLFVSVTVDIAFNQLYDLFFD